jgi:hypothetical protein
VVGDVAPFGSRITGLTGTVTFEVYADPLNTFGAGDFDFVYQVANSDLSFTTLDRLTIPDFTGWSTDVGFTYDGGALGDYFSYGGKTPGTVDRVSDDVGWVQRRCRPRGNFRCTRH